MQVLNSFAIASGYAGRDPQEGFCDGSVYVLVLKSLWKPNESSSLVFKLKKMEKNYVKVRKKMRDEEGGKNQKTAKATMYKWLFTRKWKGVEEIGDLIYRNERKERRGRNTYLDWLMTYLKTFAFYLCLGGV